jgi:F-type H+-transporting ATPase subunit delta
MKYSKKQYAVALYESFHEAKPKDYDTIIANLIEILKANGDLSEYEAIINAYEIYDREQKGISEAVVTTAHDIKQSKPLLDELNKIAATKIELVQKVDDQIIGGITIRIDDTLIDGSVRHHLDDLQDSLTNPQP